ncbi:transporter substrate-binding domain-containing protein [Pelagibius sp. 7325]|uniref:transporter substrate-binding domain-containing protein n=1 Tax=Pelagibius sp. 7325 TaxID=3131994 RepID=UPI0030EF433C
MNTGRFKALAAATGIAVLATTAMASAASADAIDDIRKRGKLIVGVKADYAPYGFLNSDGKIVGLEPDLAQDVADVLGVSLELVPVVSSNRMQFLEQGKIDLMIATMTDTAERRGVVEIVDPNYYSSGTNILTKGNFAKWEDLKGAPVCGIQGAFYNRKTSEEFGAEIVAFKGTAEALTALQQNRCVAFVYDDSFIVSRLAEADWEGWKMPLPTIDDAPWGLAVAKGQDAFAALMSGMVVKWHLSGRIVELEQKYGLEPTPFAKKMHETFVGVNPKIER